MTDLIFSQGGNTPFRNVGGDFVPEMIRNGSKSIQFDK